MLANAANKFVKISNIFISAIYFIHKNNVEFMKEFIAANGLIALTLLMKDKNLNLRGQIIDIFVSFTNSERFDWFQPLDNIYENSNTVTEHLHHQMLRLSDTKFIENILYNRVDSFPGGSSLCLQLLAFWLSWVRILYTKDKILYVSKVILDELKLWSEGMGNEYICEEEISLAKTLYQDFSTDQYQGNIPKDILEGNNNRQVLIDGILRLQPTSGVMKETADGAASGSRENRDPSIENILVLKITGNEHYKNDKYTVALEDYDGALQMLISLVSNNIIDGNSDDIKEIHSTLQYNRAAVFWKLAQIERNKLLGASNSNTKSENFDEYIDDQFSVDTSGTYELLRCEQACIAALEIDSLNIKAAYRLANVYYILRKPMSGLKVVDSCVDCLKLKSSSDMVDKKIDILKSIRRKCIALAMSLNEISVGDSPSESVTSMKPDDVIGKKTAKVLDALRNRSQREKSKVTHAWNNWQPPVDTTNENANNDDGVHVDVDVPSQSDIVTNVNNILNTTITSMKSQDKKNKNSSRTKGLTILPKNVVEIINKIKSLAMKFDSCSQNAVDFLLSSPIVAECEVCLLQLWKNSFTLSRCFTCIETDLLLLLLVTFIRLSIHQVGTSNYSVMLLEQLLEISQIDSVFKLSLYGNNEVKEQLKTAVDRSKDTIDQKTKEKILALLD